MRYRILGPLEVGQHEGGAACAAPTAPKTASVLAMLLLHGDFSSFESSFASARPLAAASSPRAALSVNPTHDHVYPL